MEPEIGGGELLRVIYGILGRRGAKVVGWLAVGVGFVAATPFIIKKVIEIEHLVTTLDFAGSPVLDWLVALFAVLLVLVVVGGCVAALTLAIVVPLRFVDNWSQSRRLLKERIELDRIKQDWLAIPNLPDEIRTRLDALTTTDLKDCVK